MLEAQPRAHYILIPCILCTFSTASPNYMKKTKLKIKRLSHKNHVHEFFSFFFFFFTMSCNAAMLRIQARPSMSKHSSKYNYLLMQECPNPVLGGRTPAGFCVLPGRNCLNQRKWDPGLSTCRIENPARTQSSRIGFRFPRFKVSIYSV